MAAEPLPHQYTRHCFSHIGSPLGYIWIFSGLHYICISPWGMETKYITRRRYCCSTNISFTSLDFSRLVSLMSLSYFEAVNILNSQETLTDTVDASQKLAKSIVKMIHEFDTVSAHLHTIDMQGLTQPMLPHWTALSQASEPLVS